MSPAWTSRSRSTRPPASSTPTAPTRLEHEGRTLSAGRAGRLLGRPRRALPDRLDRGRHGRGGLGRLEAAHRARSAAACSSSATTCSSPTPSACARGIEAGVANSILIKVNQIGTLTETLRGDRDGPRGRLHGRHEPPLGRDRGRHDRRPRGRHRLRADQDRARRRGPTAWRSTTSCCASRSSSAPRPCSRAQRLPRALSSAPRPPAGTSAGGDECRAMPSVASPRVGRRAALRPSPRRVSGPRTRLRAGAPCGPFGAAVSRLRWEQLGRLAMLACWSRSPTCT